MLSELGIVASLGLIFSLPTALAQTASGCGDLVDAAATLAPSSCVSVADVTVSNNSPVTGVNLGNIQTIGGDLDLRGADLESIEAPSLVDITGDFTIQSSKLSSLEVSKLSSLGGDLSFELSDSPLTNVNLNLSKIAVDSDFSFLPSGNIQRLSLSVTPSTSAGNRSLVIDSLFALSVLQIQGVEFTAVNITAASLSSIPNVWAPTVDGIKLYSLGLLGNISVPVNTVGSSVALAGIGSPSVLFQNLTTIGGDFSLIQTETVELSLPRLRSVSGGFTVSQNDDLRSVSVGSLESVSNMAFANNSVLAEILFPELETLGVLALQYNNYMTTLDLQNWFPELSEVTEYITLAGQFDNVTFPALQNGVGIKAPHITVISSVELDCDAVKNEVIAKQAIGDPANLVCTSGPKGSKPSVTGSPTSSTSPSPTSTNGSNGGDGSGNGSSAGKSSTNVGAIVGGTIGGVVFLIVVAVLAWVYVRRRKPESPGGQATSNKVGGIEDHVGGIDDAGQSAGGITSK
ncbi:hypothetical protein TWF281_005170 [Arthrobotrys megalospora]